MEESLIERVPTVEEYQKLRKAVGWKELEVESMKIGLRNSLFSVCVFYAHEIIG